MKTLDCTFDCIGCAVGEKQAGAGRPLHTSGIELHTEKLLNHAKA